MIFYLIKNNFKLIFRNKLAVAVLLIEPALTIALLSNAFDSLMRSYTAPDEFSVGYRCESSVFAENMEVIKDAGKKAGIILTEYPEGEPAELITNNDLAAFADIGDKSYTLYKSGDHKTECAIADHFFDRVMSEGVNTALDMIAPSAEMSSSLPVTKLESMPAVSSTDYYGIIYIVYFSSLGLVCATGMLASEKKNGIDKKYQICSLSPFSLYLARLLPTAAVVIICALIETLLTAAMFDINWGKPLVSAAVVILIILAGCALGFMLYGISRNIALTIIALFIVIWIMGFLGGSFETYMYSSISDTLKHISPFYHANRALVELSAMGHSAYTVSSVLFSGTVIAVCSAGAVAADMIRKRGKA